MPTVNQLVRHGRVSAQNRTKAPALRFVRNTLRNRVYRGKGVPKS